MKICKICGREIVNKNVSHCSKQCVAKNKLSSLEETDIQVALTGIFGDGHIGKSSGKYHTYSTNSKYKEYIDYKKSMLRTLIPSGTRESINRGYKKAKIYSFSTYEHSMLSYMVEDSVENNLKKLSLLGVALWFYDDGSLHYSKHFYNLNTHKFSEGIQYDLFVPFFKNILDVKATIAYDRKIDGRVFTYLRFNKSDSNATNINELLKKYPIHCFKYKTF